MYGGRGTRLYLFWTTGSKQVLMEVEARALDLYLAWVARKGKKNFDALPLKHRYLILQNGYFHSEYVFEYNLLTVTTVWNTEETVDIKTCFTISGFVK